MDERDLEPEEASPGRFVDQQGALVAQPPELDAQIVDLEGDVVHARAALGEELPHRRLGRERTQQLDPALAGTQRGSLDALLLDGLAVLEGRTEELAVHEHGSIEVVDRDSYVVHAPDRHHAEATGHSRSSSAYTTSLCHSPLTHSFSTRRASRRIPSFSSTRVDASLRASARPITRCSAKSSNASRRMARAASVA